MKTVIKACSLIAIAGSMMGNQSCQEAQPEARELKRRVQVSYLEAPPIRLPDGGTFDFAYVAKQQLANILSKTNSFTTAAVDPNKIYDTKGLSTAEEALFNQCANLDEETVSSNQLSAKMNFSEKASCLIDMPHGMIGGSIYDFSLISKTGATIGLAGIASLTNIGASFSYQKSELSVAMRASHPLIPGGFNGDNGRMLIATTDQKAYAKDWGGSLSIGFSMVQLGGNAYFKSNLSNVVEDGVTQAVKDLKKSWDQAEPWYAMVLKSCDKYIYINAGSSADMGLKKGDIFRIQNVTYGWEGKACGSQLLSAIDSGVATGAAPVAYAQVTNVGLTVSTAVILDKDPNYPYDPNQIIKPGARVYLEKLFVETPQAQK